MFKKMDLVTIAIGVLLVPGFFIMEEQLDNGYRMEDIMSIFLAFEFFFVFFLIYGINKIPLLRIFTVATLYMLAAYLTYVIYLRLKN